MIADTRGLGRGGRSLIECVVPRLARLAPSAPGRFCLVLGLVALLAGVAAAQTTQSQPAEKHRVAVIDFSVKGDVGITDAGAVVAELVLTRFGQGRYQLIERTQLAALLKEMDLTIAVVRDSPEKVYGKLTGVEFLVLGSVNKLGNLVITARIVDVRTGGVVQTAEVSAEDARGLQEALTELAGTLQMTEEEKRAYEARRGSRSPLGQAYLGVYVQDVVIPDQGQGPPLPYREGALVGDVEKNSPGDRANLKKGDVIVGFAGQRVSGAAHLRDMVASLRPGTTVRLEYYRDGRNEVVEAILAASPEEPGQVPRLAPELSLELGSGVAMRLVLIPAGKFMMGSPDGEEGRDTDEGPQHEVTISRPFYLGVTEVTQEQYEAIMGNNPSKFKDPQNPVECVSWNDAMEFCRRLSMRASRGVRLPTEAEWEYACRSGSRSRFCFGESDSSLAAYAWHKGNSGETTHPVGQGRPNTRGLYDVHGNVCEWCSDWYEKNAYTDAAIVDPQGPSSGTHRAMRGGAFDWGPANCRSAFRQCDLPEKTYSNVGLRVAVDAK